MVSKSTPKGAPAAQGQLFEAQTQWFHLFKAMIESGDVAKMGPYAFTVYAVIKSHTNFNTGQAFPGIETISEKAGISVPQVKRELKTLEEYGYITKTKQGRNNIYTLREKVEITDEAGRPTAVATWDYLPTSVKHAVADLKNVLLRPEFDGAKIVHIEKLQVNITTVNEGGVNYNVQQMFENLNSLPPDKREKAKQFLLRKYNMDDPGAEDHE